MLKIVKHPAAVIDITEAAIYLEEHAGLEIAVRFIDLCDAAFKTLANMPGMGSLRPVPGHPNARTWRVRPYQHMIVYGTTESAVEIIRVLHGARDLSSVLGSPSVDDDA